MHFTIASLVLINKANFAVFMKKALKTAVKLNGDAPTFISKKVVVVIKATVKKDKEEIKKSHIFVDKVSAINEDRLNEPFCI